LDCGQDERVQGGKPYGRTLHWHQPLRGHSFEHSNVAPSHQCHQYCISRSIFPRGRCTSCTPSRSRWYPGPTVVCALPKQHRHSQPCDSANSEFKPRRMASNLSPTRSQRLSAQFNLPQLRHRAFGFRHLKLASNSN
jgi:hypothetical protein